MHWQDIGDVLGTTRQAASQRFGRPIDPRTGEAMDKTVTPGATGRAVEIFAQLASGDWDGVHRSFDQTMADALSTTGLGDHAVADVPPAFEAGAP